MSIQDGPWAPFQPTRQDPWDLRKVAHLQRRAGFGATWSELQRDVQAGMERSVQRLLRPPALPNEEEQVLGGLRQGVLGTTLAGRLLTSPAAAELVQRSETAVATDKVFADYFERVNRPQAS